MTALVGLVLKVSLILVLALAALVVLRRRSAAARHWVLAFALACAAVTPLLEAFVPTWQVTLPKVSRPAARVEARVIGIRHAGSPSPEAGPSRLDMRLKVVDEAAVAAAPSDVDLTAMLWRVWLAGVAVSVLSLLLGLAWLGVLRRRSRPFEHPRWLEAASAVAAELGITRPIRLCQSDHPTLLVTWGFARPTIVVPVAAADWPDDRIRIVLYHECAHILRNDWLVQVGAALLRCAYWFNPLVWLAYARLREESERACDDVVLRHGIEASEYAAHLLHIARGFAQRREMWAPAPAIARPSSLEQRVSAMLDPRLNRRPLTPAACAVAACALLATTVPIAGFGEPHAASVLSGVLRDPAGAPVPNAAIYLTRVPGERGSGDAAAVDQLTFETDASGRFAFSGLPPGEYRMTASTPGAVPVIGLRLNAGGQVERDMTLRVGPFREAWTVVTSNLDPSTRRVTRPLPADWGCAPFGPPLCGPPSLVEEFARDEQERLARSPVLAPRRARLDAIDDYLPFRDIGVEGVVEIEGRIGTDGVFTPVRVVSADHPALEAAALESLGRMTWEPARLRGIPVDVPLTVTIDVRREPGGGGRSVP